MQVFDLRTHQKLNLKSVCQHEKCMTNVGKKVYFFGLLHFGYNIRRQHNVFQVNYWNFIAIDDN